MKLKLKIYWRSTKSPSAWVSTYQLDYYRQHSISNLHMEPVHPLRHWQRPLPYSGFAVHPLYWTSTANIEQGRLFTGTLNAQYALRKASATCCKHPVESQQPYELTWNRMEVPKRVRSVGRYHMQGPSYHHVAVQPYRMGNSPGFSERSGPLFAESHSVEATSHISGALRPEARWSVSSTEQLSISCF
jgi:hypothetical protein